MWGGLCYRGSSMRVEQSATFEWSLSKEHAHCWRLGNSRKLEGRYKGRKDGKNCISRYANGVWPQARGGFQ